MQTAEVVDNDGVKDGRLLNFDVNAYRRTLCRQLEPQKATLFQHHSTADNIDQ